MRHAPAKTFPTYHSRLLCCGVNLFFLSPVLITPLFMNAQVNSQPFSNQDVATRGVDPSAADDGRHSVRYAPLAAGMLGIDDLVELRVPYCPELSQSFRVGSDGALVLPLLHHPTQVAGLLPGQAAEHIRQALIADQIMPDPVVNLAVIEVRSRPVSVVGAVVHPLTFQATGDLTLLDAIAMAGGFAPGGATTILVSSRHRKSEGTLEVGVQEISVRGLLLANSASNILLSGGEEIRVTEGSKIFVAGNVVKPGAYSMQEDADTTVLKALALSSGLQRYSTHTAYIYRRRPGSTERDVIEVPLSRLMARKEHDMTLIADDILYIPENNGERMAAQVLAQISAFGQTTATGLLIYR